MSNRDELFNAAGKKRAEQRQKEAERKEGNYGGSDDREQLAWTSLVTGGDKVLRLLGSPAPYLDMAREKDTDPLLFWYSMIMGDNDRKFRCIWPSKEDNPNWILWRIFNLILDGQWVDNEKEYTHKKGHPILWNRVAKNNNTEQPYESGWKPSQMVVMNVIDRHDMEWHRENQHTKVLSKKGNENKEGKWFFDPGIPPKALNTVWDSVVEYYKDWETYDVVIRRQKVDPYYYAFHGEVEALKIDDAVKPFVVSGPLTDEEKNWERYELSKFFPQTSYHKLKKHLGVFFQQVDQGFNKHYAEELDDLVAKEKAVREAAKAAEEAAAPTTVPETPALTPENPVVEITSPELPVTENVRPTVEPATTPPVRGTVAPATVEDIPWVGLMDGTYNGTQYKGIELLTDEEKNMILGFNDEKKEFIYVTEWEGKPVQIYTSKGGFPSPGQFHVDPLSGDQFV